MRVSRLLSSLAIAGMMLPMAASAAFVDVGSTDAHAAAILYVQGHGIVSGYPDGTYRSDATINRAEFTKIVIGAYSASQAQSCDTSSLHFSDVDTSAWYAGYLCVAVSQGIIGGYPDGTFRPTASINFAEAAKIIAIADMHGMTEEAANGDAWYVPYTQYLAQNNALAGIGDPGHLLTRGEMAEIIYHLSLKVGGTSSAMMTSSAASSNAVSSVETVSSAAMSSSSVSSVSSAMMMTSSRPSSAAASSAAVSGNAVSISGFSFGPQTITVKAGTAVTWSNQDSVPHMIVGDSGGPSSSILQPGQSYSYTYTAAGTFTYHCGVHPGMKGTVIVTP
jgi:plastocyanin